MLGAMGETIFTAIIRGEIPCHKVYEDEQVLAFLDIGPLSRGHTLVIPKEAAATLDELSDESAAAIGRVLPRLCRAVKEATRCEAYNILQNNGALALSHHSKAGLGAGPRGGLAGGFPGLGDRREARRADRCRAGRLTAHSV
jgi:diadenosine tetraphosphate (Ap4A) HIT family hydrolase